jgi:hypothetical protein
MAGSLRRLALAWLPIACTTGAETGGSGLFATVGSSASNTAPMSTSDATGDGSDDGTSGSTAGASVGATGDTSSSADPSGSDTAAAVCGDDNLQPGEDCDGMSFGDVTCQSLGFEQGVLGCDPGCHVITDACSTCGDGEIALGEACDSLNFDGESCASLGFAGGALSCNADCTALVTTQCQPLPTCGDGVRNGGEQCDANDLGGTTCVTLGFDLGTVDCTAGCTIDSSGCMDDLENCGMMGDFCLFDENDLQSTCCPAGVGGNVLGICNVLVCV